MNYFRLNIQRVYLHTSIMKDVRQPHSSAENTTFPLEGRRHKAANELKKFICKITYTLHATKTKTPNINFQVHVAGLSVAMKVAQSRKEDKIYDTWQLQAIRVNSGNVLSQQVQFKHVTWLTCLKTRQSNS